MDIGIFSEELENLLGPRLGCLDTSVSKKRLIFQHASRI